MEKKIFVGFFVALFALGGLYSAVIIGAPSTGSSPATYGRYRFVVEIDGIVSAGFMEVEGLNVTIEVISYREGIEQPAVRLLPGIANYGPLTLRRGLTTNQELWDWMEKLLDGTVDKRNMAVVILDQSGNEIARVYLSDAWPNKWALGKLDSQDSKLAIEEIVIQYESLDFETSAD